VFEQEQQQSGREKPGKQSGKLDFSSNGSQCPESQSVQEGSRQYNGSPGTKNSEELQLQKIDGAEDSEYFEKASAGKPLVPGEIISQEAVLEDIGSLPVDGQGAPSSTDKKRVLPENDSQGTSGSAKTVGTEVPEEEAQQEAASGEEKNGTKENASAGLAEKASNQDSRNEVKSGDFNPNAKPTGTQPSQEIAPDGGNQGEEGKGNTGSGTMSGAKAGQNLLVKTDIPGPSIDAVSENKEPSLAVGQGSAQTERLAKQAPMEESLPTDPLSPKENQETQAQREGTAAPGLMGSPVPSLEKEIPPKPEEKKTEHPARPQHTLVKIFRRIHVPPALARFLAVVLMVLAAGIGLYIGFLLLCKIARDARLRYYARLSTNEVVIRLYRNLRFVYAKLGMGTEPWMTPIEAVRWFSRSPSGLLKELSLLSAVFTKVRYGRHMVSGEDMNSSVAAYAELKKNLADSLPWRQRIKVLLMMFSLQSVTTKRKSEGGHV
jgi:hypothetical protein